MENYKYLKVTVNTNFIFIYGKIFVSSVLGELNYIPMSQCFGETADTSEQTCDIQETTKEIQS